jgi:CheY-like chemotaxis protein
VDDDVDVRMIAADMLRDAGYSVVEVSSGAAALEVMAWPDHDVELVVVDVAMPDMDGVTLAGAIRRLVPGLPVLFITGYVDARLLSADGGHEILRKPFGVNELVTKVSQLVDRDLRR